MPRSAMKNKKGYFVTLEGGEGSGKSTQLKLLEDYLDKGGYDVIYTREPGGTPISEEIRKILLGGKNVEMSDETEALLFAAARAQHIKEKILPAIAEGKTVVCDRYVHSSLVYQGYARGLGEFVEKVNSYALENCMPDVTIFLDITPERAFARKGGADADDRLEQSGIDFHRRVYDGYVRMAEKFPDHFVRVNADRGIDEVFAEILDTLRQKGVIR
jgi:dTMP kinase